jgi:hypothetical protein
MWWTETGTAVQSRFWEFVDERVVTSSKDSSPTACNIARVVGLSKVVELWLRVSQRQVVEKGIRLRNVPLARRPCSVG